MSAANPLTEQALSLVQPMPEIEESTNVWPSRAESFEIHSPEDYEMAAGSLKGIKALQKQVKEACKPVKSAANAAHKAATKQENDFLAPLNDAERVFKRKMISWDDEQERLARETQKAIAEAAAKAEEETRLAQAAALEEQGREEEAIQVLDTPAPIPAAIAPQREKVSGISRSKKWNAEVVNLREFLQGVLDGKIPESAVLPNEKLLRQQAVALQDALQWPGVKVSSSTQISARG